MAKECYKASADDWALMGVLLRLRPFLAVPIVSRASVPKVKVESNSRGHEGAASAGPKWEYSYWGAPLQVYHLAIIQFSLVKTVAGVPYSSIPNYVVVSSLYSGKQIGLLLFFVLVCVIVQ